MRRDGHPALRITRAGGSVWMNTAGRPNDDIIKELSDMGWADHDSWDSDLGFKLRGVPVKADAKWLASVEKIVMNTFEVTCGMVSDGSGPVCKLCHPVLESRTPPLFARRGPRRVCETVSSPTQTKHWFVMLATAGNRGAHCCNGEDAQQPVEP